MIPFSGFKGATLVDYPGKVASIIFLSGCNLRCPYCHNGQLFLDDDTVISAHFLMDKLLERSSFIDGVVFTGGEPSLHAELVEFISEVSRLTALDVKIDSNGLNPEFIERVANFVDYYAIDIKTTPELYATTLGANINEDMIEENLMKTKAFLERKTDKTIEYRTTLYPPVLSLSHLKDMARFVPSNARWSLQRFVSETAWTQVARNTVVYTDNEIQDMVVQLKNATGNSDIVFRA